MTHLYDALKRTRSKKEHDAVISEFLKRKKKHHLPRNTFLSWHEAGHAAVGLFFGYKPAVITNKPIPGHFGGHVEFLNHAPAFNPAMGKNAKKSRLNECVFIDLAGAIAVQKERYLDWKYPSQEWLSLEGKDGDVTHAIQRYCEARDIPPDKGLAKRIINDEIGHLVSDLLDEIWGAVSDLSAATKKHRVIRWPRIKKIARPYFPWLESEGTK